VLQANGFLASQRPEIARLSSNPSDNDKICPVDAASAAVTGNLTTTTRPWSWPFTFKRKIDNNENNTRPLQFNSTQINLDEVSQRNETGSPHHENHHHHHGNPAMHQLDHRAKEKASFKLGERVAEQVVKTTEKQLERQGERLAEKAAGRLERTFEKVVEKAAKTSGERTAERMAVKVGERSAERASDNILREMWKSLSSVIGRGERLVERSGDRIVERASERALERAGERSGERFAERAVERAAERSGERLAKRAGERAAERSGERIVEHASERALERAGERSGERLAERMGERALERIGERSGERVVASGKGLGRGIERVFGVSSEKLALRLGRGVLITLPILGGVFALWLLKSDIARLKEEWALRAKTSSAFFLGAGLVDGLDSILHFFIAFALLKHLSHHRLAVAEELSFACAIISTVCAVVGEVISLRIQKQKDDAALENNTVDTEPTQPSSGTAQS